MGISSLLFVCLCFVLCTEGLLLNYFLGAISFSVDCSLAPCDHSFTSLMCYLLIICSCTMITHSKYKKTRPVN